MSLKKPFLRTIRPDISGEYHNCSSYIYHAAYVKNPERFIHSFLLIQKDLQTLFEYIQPSDANSICYSHRVHELLFRTCVEVEANLTAILKDNGYSEGQWNMRDYSKVDRTHRLSSYKVTIPNWDGEKDIRQPFKSWPDGSLEWYQCYNKVKHNRTDHFDKATFGQEI